MHFNGLTDKQVEESRKKYGSNVIPDSEPTTFWVEFKETFKDPMIRILLAIAALMIVMCVLGYAEIYEPIGTVVAVLIVAFVSAKTGVASDTKYRQLKDSTKKDQCKVYRNGLVTVIDVDDVVVGDKVLLQSGDKVPADGVLIHGTLRVDNSALNGEAEECPKTAADESFPLPEDITALYGSLRDRGCTRVLHISISAGLSGTYNMCRMLAEEAEGIRVDVVDSRTLSCGLGLLVLTAAEMLEAGHPVEEVIAALEEKRKTQLGCFVIRTLEYLRKGGRIGLVAPFCRSSL